MQFRPKSFWTPRYIRDRLALDLHQRRYPELPWWPADAIRHLGDMLLSTDTVLEWGSGRSTAWLVKHAGAVHSIEHDREWYDRVRSQLGALGVPDAVRLLDDGPESAPDASPYVRVVDEFADGELNVCIVDGAHRGHCALAATERLSPYGLLMVDDIHWFLDHPTGAPHARQGRGPKDAVWREFQQRVANWRVVWTTDGVTDTAIWVKPPK